MKFTKKMPWTVEELKNVYEQTDSGHWFERGTMRFFKTRLTPYFRRIDDKTALFITTEQGPAEGSTRKATIRRATIEDTPRSNGDMISKVSIETVGEFNSLTVYKAKQLMKEI